MTKNNFFLSVACATILFFSAGKVSAAAPNLYEGFDYPLGTTAFNYDPTNWQGDWQTYGGSGLLAGNTTEGIDTSSPLVVPNLVQTGNYVCVFNSWGVNMLMRDINRNIWGGPNECPYLEYMNGQKLGAPGTTIWISIILRPQGTIKTCYLGGGGYDELFPFSIGAFGGEFWGLKIGATEYPTTVPIVDDEAAFLVCSIEFGGLPAGGADVTLYVNPAPGTDPGTDPLVATVSASTVDDLSFSHVKLKTEGSGNGLMAADELRIATTYELVAPSAGGATGIAKNVVENARVYSNKGKIVADLTSVKGASTVSVIDTKGSVIKTVQSAGAELLNINVANKGIYMVQVKNAGKTSTVKVAL